MEKETAIVLVIIIVALLFGSFGMMGFSGMYGMHQNYGFYFWPGFTGTFIMVLFAIVVTILIVFLIRQNQKK